MVAFLPDLLFTLDALRIAAHRLDQELTSMTVRDKMRLALHDLFASRFSLSSNLLAVGIGVGFLGLLLSLAIGVSQFFESYYTRTSSLTTILAFFAPESGDARPFDPDFRALIARQPGIDRIIYHDIDFASLELYPGRKADVAVRSGIANDPEIERLERVAGTNLTQFTDFSKPAVVISLARAMKLSDSPAHELIGCEVAVTFNRSMRMEDEPERESVYATIVGIVQESPDEAIYLPYQVLAAAHAWQRQSVPLDEGERLELSPSILTATEDDTDAPVAAVVLETASETTAELLAEAETIPSDSVTAYKIPVPEELTLPRFQYSDISDAYSGLAETLANDSVVYPHLRIHCRDLDSLIALRTSLRNQGIPTTAVLDDIASIRELRRYALMVFGLIGCITLLAAICSIFNTLLAAVERRTREIGILRALGASKVDVLTIFLIEGVLIGVTGSLMATGVIKLLSMQLNQFVLTRLAADPDFQRLASLSPSVFAYPYWLPLTVIAIGATAAFAAALLPAAKACSISPVEALRHTG